MGAMDEMSKKVHKMSAHVCCCVGIDVRLRDLHVDLHVTTINVEAASLQAEPTSSVQRGHG